MKKIQKHVDFFSVQNEISPDKKTRIKKANNILHNDAKNNVALETFITFKGANTCIEYFRISLQDFRFWCKSDVLLESSNKVVA